MSSKHDKTEPRERHRDDLKDNPGIGQSKGLFRSGESPNEIGGLSTVEGDRENDSSLGGGARAADRGRTHE